VVDVKKGGGHRSDRSGVVVYLQGVDSDARVGKVEVRQKNMKFTPAVLVVPRGTTVDFPNDDRFAHNVFSNTRGATFDLGEYKRGDSKSHTFRRAGEVDVYCNIHATMSAKIKVVDSHHYTVTDADGRFAIAGVPPGTYPVVAWLPNAVEARGEVTVAAGKTASIRIELQEGQAPSRHLRKDGSPYGRY
jgi:plastocyanin